MKYIVVVRGPLPADLGERINVAHAAALKAWPQPQADVRLAKKRRRHPLGSSLASACYPR